MKKLLSGFLKNFKNPKKRWFIIRDIILACFVAFFFFGAVFILWAASLKTPDLSSFDDRILGQSTKIYDRTGNVLLYDLNQKIRRTNVPLDNISPFIKQATISIEDDSFYSHNGIELKSILRAVWVDLTSLRLKEGGSTITQQVVKNSLLSSDKSLSRKLKEWVLALKLEQVADKDTILSMYLNESPYGGNIYGVEEASETYFGKKSSDVTLSEAAYLASLPKGPTLYSPYGKNKQLLVNRKNTVLDKMLAGGYITQAQLDDAKKNDAKFLPQSIGGIKAPHFVMFIKQYLDDKYGEDQVQQGGLKVITTLDYDIQAHAENIVKTYVNANEKTFKAENGSIVVIDPKTGQILAMVGSRDYFDTKIDGNFNVATAHRQPGSAFKPFAYATAFNKGYLPETPIFDVPTEFSTQCNPLGTPNYPGAVCYKPDNYEGGFKGLMTFRSALAQSRNVPSVKVLYLAGLGDTVKTAQAMGIESLGDPNQYGLTLVLGGGEVSLLDMTSAYGVFAQNGNRNPYTGILSVQDKSGSVIEEFATSTTNVLPEQSALLINDILSDPISRSSIFSTKYLGTRQVAIKTGTTNNSKDAWIIGYTPDISVGAWMGNNDNTPMAQKASATIVAPMWKQLMTYILEKIPDDRFPTPEPADPNIKPFIKGDWQNGTGQVHSELYWIDRSNPLGPAPINPNNDSQFNSWEYGVLNWAQSPAAASLIQNPSGTQINSGNVTIISSPRNGSGIKNTDRTIISLDNISPYLQKVEYYINGNLIGTASEKPFSFSFIPQTTQGVLPENELKAVLYDTNNNKTEIKSLFSVTQ